MQGTALKRVHEAIFSAGLLCGVMFTVTARNADLIASELGARRKQEEQSPEGDDDRLRAMDSRQNADWDNVEVSDDQDELGDDEDL